MAMGMLEIGPKFNWTRDKNIYDYYPFWKRTSEQKVSYLKYWMGGEGIPLIRKWTATGKLDFSNAVKIPARE